MIKALINVRIYDYTNYIENGYIIFDEVILEVGQMNDFSNQNYELIDGEGDLVIPGLVNGHTHIYSTFARGMSVRFNPKDFQGILDDLWWKMDHSLDKDIVYYSAIVHAIDSLKNGVTTLIDHHASGQDILGTLNSLKEAVTETVGLRGAFAFETSDRFNIEACIEENLRFYKENQTAMARGHFGLHASMSLSEETLKRVSDVLDNAPIHIHVAESELDQTDALKHYQERVVHRLKRHGLLTPKSILTHALYVDQSEIDVIKAHDCVVALNVTSNMNNGVGLPDVMRFRKEGVPLIVGNDGISTTVVTEYLYLLYSMHHKASTPVDFGLDDVLDIIRQTYRYASSLFEIKLGEIKKDFKADFMRISYTPPTPMNTSNAFGHLFFGLFHSLRPKEVYINGLLKVEDGQVNSSLMELYEDAQTYAERLWDAIKKEEEKHES